MKRKRCRRSCGGRLRLRNRFEVEVEDEGEKAKP